MEQMFRIMFERLLGMISIGIITGLIVAWSIDMQKKAAQQKSVGLISLTKLNQALMKKDKRLK